MDTHTTVYLGLTLSLLVAPCLGACQDQHAFGNGVAGQPTTDGQSWAAGDTDANGSPVVVPVCGNGTVDRDEACDDGNTSDGDFCAADCSAVDWTACDEAAIESVPSGWWQSGPMGDMVSLCGTYLIVADRAENAIKVVNAANAHVIANYALTAAPSELAYDRETQTLYVGLEATSLTRLDIETGSGVNIPLSAKVRDLTLGPNGRVFALLDDTQSWPDVPVAIIDGPNGAVVTEQVEDYHATLAVYDAKGAQLILTDTGGSPSSMQRWAYDSATDTLTLSQATSGDSGSNGQDLAISPDYSRIAFPNGAGNGDGYTIFDYSPADLSVVAGEWDTGAYPRAADFSPDSKWLLASNGKELFVFNADTHTKVKTWELEFDGCGYDSLKKVRFSPGGSVVFAYADCGIDDDDGRVFAYWWNPATMVEP